MSAKHTPGPWQTRNHAISVDILDASNGPVANVVVPVWAAIDEYDRHGARGKAHANARLISAAPELLEELECLERVSGSAMMADDPARVRARAAIAKAKGGAS